MTAYSRRAEMSYGSDIPSSSSAGLRTHRPCTCHPEDIGNMPCQHQYSLTECKAKYGTPLVRNLRGCHHGKTWTEYCRDCEIVGLREQYRNGLRQAENARQRLMAMGEMAAQSPVEEPDAKADQQWRDTYEAWARRCDGLSRQIVVMKGLLREALDRENRYVMPLYRDINYAARLRRALDIDPNDYYKIEDTGS